MINLLKITSVNNQKVRDWHKLLDKKGRRELNKYLIEGSKMVEEALLFAEHDLETIIFNENIEIPNEFYEKLKNKNIELITVSETIIKKLSDTKTPQGIIAVLNNQPLTLEKINLKSKKFILVIDRINDPGNLGTIIRTADAFGVDLIILSLGSADLYNPKTLRASMGSIFHLPIVLTNLNDAFIKLNANNIPILGAVLEATKMVDKFSYADKISLVIGNEANGIDKKWYPYFTDTVKIPMFGKAESLNAGIATAIIVYEIARSRQLAIE